MENEITSQEMERIRTLNTKAKALHELGRNVEALAVINEALRIVELPALLNTKAHLLKARGRYDEAIKAINRALELID